MRVFVSGSRGLTKVHSILDRELKELPVDPTLIIHGGCKNSADEVAQEWAHFHNIPTEIHIPDWDTYGKAAGPMRNKAMIERCDYAIVFWDGESKGAGGVIWMLEKTRIPHSIYNYKGVYE